MTQIVLNIEDKNIVASLKRVLSTMNGVTIASSKNLSSYEKSKIEARNGKINTYASVDELFAKNVISNRIGCYCGNRMIRN